MFEIFYFTIKLGIFNFPWISTKLSTSTVVWNWDYSTVKLGYLLNTENCNCADVGNWNIITLFLNLDKIRNFQLPNEEYLIKIGNWWLWRNISLLS